MSKIQEEVMAANEVYASKFGGLGSLPMPPGRGFAILTCMGMPDLTQPNMQDFPRVTRMSSETQGAGQAMMQFVHW